MSPQKIHGFHGWKFRRHALKVLSFFFRRYRAEDDQRDFVRYITYLPRFPLELPKLTSPLKSTYCGCGSMTRYGVRFSSAIRQAMQVPTAKLEWWFITTWRDDFETSLGEKNTQQSTIGGFLKWWYPQSPPQVLIIFSRKTHGFVGETHHLRKHLFWEVRCACCKIQLSRLADLYSKKGYCFSFWNPLWVDGVLGFKC